MRAPNLAERIAWLLVGGALLTAGKPSARAEEGVEGVTAVASRVSKDYVRTKLADGSFQPEAYAFGEGGNWGGEIKDASIDKLHFIDVAKVIAAPLASRKYFPASDPKTTRLLIMVYWGTTEVPPPYEEDTLYNNYQQSLSEYRILMEVGLVDEANNVLSAGLKQLDFENKRRDRIDFANAGMIGYNYDEKIGTDYSLGLRRTAMRFERDDLISEIEENRYFVVLMAYDFQLLLKERKHRLLWETRFSISERRNQFDKALPVMARYASQYFGQASGGLVRTRVPEGSVEVKEPTLIEFISDLKK
jgi:hypothetical protein